MLWSALMEHFENDIYLNKIMKKNTFREFLTNPIIINWRVKNYSFSNVSAVNYKQYVIIIFQIKIHDLYWYLTTDIVQNNCMRYIILFTVYIMWKKAF